MSNALPPEVFACCKKPRITVMDYVKYTNRDWPKGKARINRVCLSCYAHWFGNPTRVRKYTRQTWEAYLEAGMVLDNVVSVTRAELRLLREVAEAAREFRASYLTGDGIDEAEKILFEQLTSMGDGTIPTPATLSHVPPSDARDGG